MAVQTQRKEYMTETASRLDWFVLHFHGQIDRISSLQGPSGETYRKVLYVALLDALAYSVFPDEKPDEKKDSARFVALIRDFANWRHKDLVSLPHLVRLLKLIEDPAFDKLRSFAEKKLASWKGSSGAIPLTADPGFEEIAALWPEKSARGNTIAEKTSLRSLQHHSLLYACRNALVHALRSTGSGTESKGHTDPYYHEAETFGNLNKPPRRAIELVYPAPFLENLCRSVVENLTRHFVDKGINPYASFDLGTYWIGEINF